MNASFDGKLSATRFIAVPLPCCVHGNVSVTIRLLPEFLATTGWFIGAVGAVSLIKVFTFFGECVHIFYC